jgi:DNA-binding NtrC family response regulator
LASYAADKAERVNNEMTVPLNSKTKRILVLEDSRDRQHAFQKVVDTMAEMEMAIWDNAHQMNADLPKHLIQAAVISLDYDLLPESRTISNPGTGMDVCRHLASMAPVCPVILHTANESAAWEMLFELSRAGWNVDWLRHELVGEMWIGRKWLPKVKSLLP